MKLVHGDSLDVLKEMEANTVDTIVTDPPYGLSFMGKKWDYDVPSVELWTECLRVLKPGGTMLCFAGSRTQHRMAVNVEDAGFELFDTMLWIFGSGFPKSHNIEKALTKQEHPEASTWSGWGTQLKPAYEPIICAKKPLEGTYAANALKHGVSGLNIDGGRIGTGEDRTKGGTGGMKTAYVGGELENNVKRATGGRFPANIILDEETGEMLDEQSGVSKEGNGKTGGGKNKGSDINLGGGVATTRYPGQGGASRFFYCAKASKAERNAGCEGLEAKSTCENEKRTGQQNSKLQVTGQDRKPSLSKNNHPTVKPTKLMEYLCTLTKTPTGGTVLDPFMGSGTTGLACKNTGRDFIGIEREAEYIEIARARLGDN